MNAPNVHTAQGLRVQALAQAFALIGQTRMQGVPVQNLQLCVQAIGFEATPGLDNEPEALSGILITPWFMNLVRLPVAADAPTKSWLAPGRKGRRTLGSECFEFIGASEDRLGVFEVCSLFSPMFEFANQQAAVATATHVLALLREPVAAPVGSASTSLPPSRRGFLFGRAAGAGA
ncbi:[NiFe]-hydrogenase assembly chaperone HybE [Rhodoferax antarcticus]|uniref:[NiFe]-hydrogenase assembly chaperone HybE n=1 Tax=Rhodoferax antarcticus TaxID=81479 RepID=UPI0022250341|nr:[NiFe]-hydrogenase assembly chaperone HybE [Rhodoferax antarcticus]MCW2314125.1 [NiFe] hydrogenase assembly HybE family chaperone [Rhodoferax antarcticus]